MFESWLDQRRDLSALQSLLADGRADEIMNDGIGPAYIGAAAVVHYVTRLGPEDALVALTQAGFVLTVAGGVLLVRTLVRRLSDAPLLVSLGAQIVFVSLVFAAGTWHWSDVPWSHFFAAFLAVGIYAARYIPPEDGGLSAGVVGAGVALLWLTRTFELLAVLVAWVGTLALFAVLRLVGPRTIRAVHVLSGAAAFLVTTTAVYLITGKRDLFFLYEGRLDSQSGSVRATEVAETPTLSLGLVPTKLVQLFVDPCFDSLCSVSDYSGQASQSPLLTEEAGNLRLWSLPLGVQLPSLLLIPVCLMVVGVLVVLAARRRGQIAEKARELRLLTELSLASAAIVLGYTSSTLTGPAHLRYGFARDFLLPAFLSGIAAVSLLSVGVWALLSRRKRPARWSPEFKFVMLSFVASAASSRHSRTPERTASRESRAAIWPRSRTPRRVTSNATSLSWRRHQGVTRRRYPMPPSSRSTVETQTGIHDLRRAAERGRVARSNVPGSPARRRLAHRHGAPARQLRAGRGRCAKRLARRRDERAGCRRRSRSRCVPSRKRCPETNGCHAPRHVRGDGHVLEAKGEVVAGGRPGVPALGSRTAPNARGARESNDAPAARTDDDRREERPQLARI